MKIRAQTLSHIMNAVLLKGNPDSLVGEFSIDTRTIKQGDWFVAFKGKNADGNDFISDALTKGAAGIITTDSTKVPHNSGETPVLQIGSSNEAFRNFAQYIRVSTALFPWYAITGSVGKTTTKGVLAEILKCEGAKPLVTPGNYNTDIGVPLTLSKFLTSSYDSFVLEFAMRAKGEIGYLADMTQPHIGVITNIAPCHLETLGSLENIAEAKSELLTYIDKRGVAVLNKSDGYYDFFRSKFDRYAVTFSYNGELADVMASEWDWDDEKNIIFKLAIQGSKPEKIKLNTPSLGMAQSAVAAVAAAVAGKIRDQFIHEGLTKYSGEELRMSIFVKVSGVKVILDCYNANPKSMMDALRVLSIHDKESRTIAVLGGMLELGDDSRKWHQNVAEYVYKIGIQTVISVGSEAMAYHEYLKDKNHPDSYHFNSNPDVIEWLKNNTKPGDTVLIKGSRGFKLEEVGKGEW